MEGLPCSHTIRVAVLVQISAGLLCGSLHCCETTTCGFTQSPLSESLRMVDFDYPGCRFGSVITSQEECEDVAHTLGVSWEGVSSWDSDRPLGCGTDRDKSKVYLNVDPTGGRSTSYASVCKMGGKLMHTSYLSFQPLWSASSRAQSSLTLHCGHLHHSWCWPSSLSYGRVRLSRDTSMWGALNGASTLAYVDISPTYIRAECDASTMVA